MIRTSRTLGVLVLQLALATSAVAQTTGSIRGQIIDEEGNPLPGVTVTATSVGRGTSRTAVSGESGAYALPSLTVDTYDVIAKLDGFQKQKIRERSGQHQHGHDGRRGDAISGDDHRGAGGHGLGGA